MSRLPVWVLNVDGVTYGTGRPIWRRGREVFDLSDRVTGFTYEAEEGSQDKVTLSVANQDLAYFKSPVLMKNTVFSFSFGYRAQLSPGGQVQVQGVRGFEQLSIEAYGKAPALTTSQHTTTWFKKTRSQIVDIIARSHDIRRTRISPTFATENIVQSGITDWRFLLELAEPFGYSVYFTIEQGVRVLHWRSRAYTSAPVRIFKWQQPGLGPRIETARSAPLLEFSIDTSKSKGKPSKVKATGYDSVNRKPLGETGDRTTAPEVGKLGFSTEVATPEESAGRNEDTISIVPTAHESVEKVRGEATTRYQLAQDDQILATAIIEGEPTIITGQIVEIGAVPRFLAGNYYVKGVKHTIAGDGYKTTMKLSRNAVGPLPISAVKQTPAPGPPNRKSAKDADPNALVPRSGLDSDGRSVVIFGPPNLAG